MVIQLNGGNMNTNLDSLFKTNSSLEKDGVVFSLGNGISFNLRRFGGSNASKVKQAMAKYHKPYARLLESDKLSIEESNLIMAKVFVEACVISWEGIKNSDGSDIPFTFDNAVKLFTELPDLFQTLFNHCNSMDSFKEDLGNF